MRIVQINEKYGIVGGSEKTMRRCVDRMRDEGHDVLVVHGEAEAAGEPGSVFFPSVREATPFRWKPALRDIADALGRFAPDVVHFRNFDAPRVVLEVSKSYPTVRTVHTPWTYCPTGTKYWPVDRRVCDRPFGWRCLAAGSRRGCGRREDGGIIGAAEMIRRIAACYAFRRADANLGAVVVTSEWMKEMLVAAGQNESLVQVVPPPVDVPPESAPANGGPPLVVAVGRASYIKGFDDLIAAVAKLPEAVTLTLVGDGPQLDNLKSLAGRMGLNGRVRFTGWVRYEEMAEIYRRAHVVALPSLCPEAFGNVGVEALSHGRPVVAYRVGGIPEWLADGEVGLLAKSADPEDLAAKLNLLLEDPDRAGAMGTAGRAAVGEYSLGRHVGATLEVYERAGRRRCE
jgi:glycosyltransferase involved in cell wall biosynthesis